MKKLILPIILFMMFMPFYVNAETKTYNICQEGCEYNSILKVWQNVNKLDGSYDVVINFDDNGPYNFLDDFLFSDAEQYQVSLKSYSDLNGSIYGDDGYEYYCDDNGIIVSLSNMRVIDYNTRNMTCILTYEDEYQTSPYIYNSKINSVTINGYENGRTTIDVVDSLSEGSLFKDLERFFFSGVVNTKKAKFNNIDFVGSFYAGSDLEEKPQIYADNCNFRHGILAYGVDLNISNSNINKVYSLGNGTKVWLETNNKFINDEYQFPSYASILAGLNETSDNDNYEELEYIFLDGLTSTFEDDSPNALLNNYIDMVFYILGMDSTKSTLLKIDNGEILISNPIKNITMSLSDTKEIKKIIDELSDKNYEYVIEDETVLNIEDGKIIPKKLGTTMINITTSDGLYYRISVEVKRDEQSVIINPNTGTGTYIILFIIFLAITSSIYLFMKKRRNFILK